MDKILNNNPYMIKSITNFFELFELDESFIPKTSKFTQFIYKISSDFLTSDFVNSSYRQQFIWFSQKIFNKVQNFITFKEASRELEFLLNIIILILNNFKETTLISLDIHKTIENYFEKFNDVRCSNNLYQHVRRLLSKTIQQGTRINHAEIMFIYPLVIPLAKYLYYPDISIEIPTLLMPSVFFSVEFPKYHNIVDLYQKSLKSIVNACYNEASQIILKNIQESFQINNSNNHLSAPLKTPLATISQWLKESKNDEKTLNKLQLILKVLEPETDEQVNLEINNFKYPVHHIVLEALMEYKNKDVFLKYPGYNKLCFKPNTFDELWNVDWFSIQEDIHIKIFSNTIFPPFLNFLVEKLTIPELQNYVALNLTRMNIQSFMEFYFYNFPDNTLSNCLSLFSKFSLKLPFPSKSLYFNINYLDKLGLWDDSLGILKTEFPKLSDATSFHQLSLYNSAKEHYLISMKEDKSSYFYSLAKLRSVSINLILGSKNISFDNIIQIKPNSQPIVTLPLLQDISSFSKDHFQTSYLSQSYLNSLFYRTMYDEVNQMFKVYSPANQNDINSIRRNIQNSLRVSNIMWMNSLDKQMAMTSNFIWRFAILNDYIEKRICIDEIEKIKEVIRSNNEHLSSILFKVGKIKQGLKFYKNSFAKYNISINSINLPSILNFLKTIDPINTNFQALLFNIYLYLKDYKLVFQMKTQTNWLSFMVNFIFNYFQQSRSVNEQESLFGFLVSMMNNSDSESFCIFQTLILSCLKIRPSLIKLINVNNDIKEEKKHYWLTWLPQLFRICQTLPEEFLLALFKSQPYWFIFLFNHSQYSKVFKDTQIVTEIVNYLSSKGNYLQYLNELNCLFGFLEKCDDDIKRLDESIEAIKKFYRCIISNNFDNFTNENTNYTTFDELKQFCIDNPPYFKTNQQLTLYRPFFGIRIPNHNNIIRIWLEADGEKEAIIHFVNFKGEVKSYHLLPSSIYPLSHREFIFVSYANRCIRFHPSSSTRNSLIFYPQSLLIHPKLRLVMASNITFLNEIIQPFNLFDLYSKSSKDKVFQDNSSPKTIHQKRSIDLPNDTMFNWFIKGCNGIKNDFLSMRQSFASFFGSISYLHLIFGSTRDLTSSIIFMKDRQRICIPGFFNDPYIVSHIFLSNQIQNLIPKYFLKGSFSTSWNILASSLFDNLENLRYFINSLVQFEGNYLNNVMEKITKTSIHTNENTEKTIEYFPFKLLDHLIENSNNVFNSQFVKIGWT